MFLPAKLFSRHCLLISKDPGESYNWISLAGLRLCPVWSSQISQEERSSLALKWLGLIIFPELFSRVAAFICPLRRRAQQSQDDVLFVLSDGLHILFFRIDRPRAILWICQGMAYFAKLHWSYWDAWWSCKESDNHWSSDQLWLAEHFSKARCGFWFFLRRQLQVVSDLVLTCSLHCCRKRKLHLSSLTSAKHRGLLFQYLRVWSIY